MERAFNFAETKPKESMKWAKPLPPTRPGWIVFAGGSELGSHMITSAMGCVRAFWYARNGVEPPPSDRSGRVEVRPDPSDSGVLAGPFQPDVLFHSGETVWMARGTLVHVALAHALIIEAGKRGEAVVVCGRTYTPDTLEQWYSPEEAVETASALMGASSFTYALPAARRMIPQAKRWATRIVESEQPVAIETQLAWNVPGPWIYTARLDLVTRNRASGMYRAWDYKTATNPKREKSKYAISAQLHGQNMMGRLWAGAQWAGVTVLLVEDTGKDEQVGVMEPYELPASPVAQYVDSSVSEAMFRAYQQLETVRTRGIGSVPASPFHCSGCRERTQCYAGR